ncbi:hypothetical protein, partial [Alteribacillus sp. HJP-4]|uniref:hypothetical protein n=1 Tax=Alteribacillus sp. HJP-4 TaxID=2775394 RepID=UPI0035CD32BE
MHMTRNSYPFLFLDNSSIKDKGACVFFMRDNCFKTPTFIVEPFFIWINPLIRVIVHQYKNMTLSSKAAMLSIYLKKERIFEGGE